MEALVGLTRRSMDNGQRTTHLCLLHTASLASFPDSLVPTIVAGGRGQHMLVLVALDRGAGGSSAACARLLLERLGLGGGRRRHFGFDVSSVVQGRR